MLGRIKDFISKPKLQLNYTKHEMIAWMRFANAGMLGEGNITAFEYVIDRLPSDNPVIEIGSFCGLSTNMINFYLQKFGRTNKLITCDKWVFEGAEKQSESIPGTKIKYSDYRTFVRNSFINNVNFFSQARMDKTFTIEEVSDFFFELWKEDAKCTEVFGKEIRLGGEISFAFIDGNHTYDFAKKDFLHVDQYLEPGGYILFDDSADGSGWEVCKVIDEIKLNPQYEIVMKFPNYLVKKVGHGHNSI